MSSPSPARLILWLNDGGETRPRLVGANRPVIGYFEGSGIGPEVIAATLRVLAAVEEVIGTRFDLRQGGAIAEASESRSGPALPDEAIKFCESVFTAGGLVMSGPGGGRYVYDLRRRFDLFCWFVPVRPWREIGLATAGGYSAETVAMNADRAAYELVREPGQFDVMVTPNMIGDILADIAGVLVVSRGVTYAGNFDPEGNGVYQTNHGCAFDLVGRDIANPAGQILSMAMLLRESFGLDIAASRIEHALRWAWHAGWRTADVAASGCRVVGTRAMAQRVVEGILDNSDTP